MINKFYILTVTRGAVTVYTRTAHLDKYLELYSRYPNKIPASWSNCWNISHKHFLVLSNVFSIGRVKCGPAVVSSSLIFFSGEKYITTQEYKAENSDEISFGAGVTVEVLQKNFEGWWLIRYAVSKSNVSRGALLQYTEYVVGKGNDSRIEAFIVQDPSVQMAVNLTLSFFVIVKL